MLEPFEGPVLKLRRGQRHTMDLSALLNDYNSRAPVRHVVRPSETRPGYTSGKIVVREAPPRDAAAILGDAIHNMRVPLDLLANDLVRMEKESTDGVYFPFAKSKDELERQIKRRNLLRAAPKAVDLVRTLAPYPGGNARLRGLHDLDVQDKHQAIIPATAQVQFPTVGVGLLALSKHIGVVMETETLAAAYNRDASLLGEEFPVKFDFVFPMLGPFSNLGTTATLFDLGQYLFGVLQSFAELYGRTLD